MKKAKTQYMPNGFSEKFAKAARYNNPQYLWAWMVNHKTYAPELKRNKLRRPQPEEAPTISVEIKHIVKAVRRDGTTKKSYGFVFKVDDEAFTIIFGSKDQSMLYLCTLLRQKMGEKMYLHEFYNNTKGDSSKAKFKKLMSDKWLKAVYDSIYPFDARDFKEWIGKVRSGNGRPMNQGKSQSSRQLEELFESHPSAIYYCTISTREDEVGDSFYDLKIPSNMITVPENMQFLIDDFEELMGI